MEIIALCFASKCSHLQIVEVPDMRQVAFALALTSVCAQTAFAQNQTTASAEIYLKTATVLENVLTLGD